MSMLTDVKSGLFSYSRSLAKLSSEPAVSFKPTDDVACAQMSNYADAMETQVTAVHKHSKRFIERHRALAGSMSGFGLSLTQLANCEAEINASLAKSLSTMGMCVDRMSNLYDEQASREGAAFEEPMRDYIRMIGQCKQAVGARAAALASLNEAARSLALKRERHEKLRGRSSKDEVVGQAAAEVREAEAVHSIAKQEYETVAARVDSEMARFQREKLADFKQMLVGFVTLQLEYSKRIQSAWRDLLPHLEGISDPEAQGDAGIDVP
jgi:sorting nexin-1/2